VDDDSCSADTSHTDQSFSPTSLVQTSPIPVTPQEQVTYSDWLMCWVYGRQLSFYMLQFLGFSFYTVWDDHACWSLPRGYRLNFLLLFIL